MGTFTRIEKKIIHAERELREARKLLNELREVIKWQYNETDTTKINKIKEILEKKE